LPPSTVPLRLEESGSTIMAYIDAILLGRHPVISPHHTNKNRECYITELPTILESTMAIW